ncbi:hypothetical protein D9M72_391300 [compost metagenome]
MEDLAQFDVVVLAARTIAELAELEPGHVFADAHGADFAIFDHQDFVFLSHGAIRQQTLEAAAQAGLGLSAQRVVEQLSLFQGAQTIVHAAVDVDDISVLLEQRDGRQETRALQAVLVEAIGHDVGGGHQTDAVLEQLFEERGQDHGVGDIGDEEFVEADHPCLIGETLADDGQRVLLALEGFHFLVDALHEAVEVGTHLLLERQCVVEGIHQVGLAATYATPEVQALHRPLALLAEQAAQQAGLVTVFGDQVVIQPLQVANGGFLCSVVEKIRPLEIGLVALEGSHDR